MDNRALINEIYDQISLPSPHEIITFSSIEDVFNEFQEWSSRVEQVHTCFWQYQFPMVLPSSYWGRFHLKKDNYRLDVVRTPNTYRCFTYGQHIEKNPIQTLNESVYLRLCNEVEQIEFSSISESPIESISTHYPTEIDIFDSMMISEDPSCQIDITDLIFLGDFKWLQKELWLLNKFKNSYGIPINQRMCNTLQNIIDSKKILLTFKNIVIVINVT